jgi:transposase
MTALPKQRADAPRISPSDRALLVKWSRSRTLAARIVLRSRIVLMLADGHAAKAIAERLGVTSGTVRLWKRRFREGGPQALLRDAPGRGRKPRLDATTRQALREGLGHELTIQESARKLGVSASTVSRWRRRHH